MVLKADVQEQSSKQSLSKSPLWISGQLLPIEWLTILTGKTVFYSIQCMNSWLTASDLFDMFTQSILFCYTFH